jgi:hypothetical protein
MLFGEKAQPATNVEEGSQDQPLTQNCGLSKLAGPTAADAGKVTRGYRSLSSRLPP